MNTKKLEIAIEQLERVHRDMNDCANKFILKDAIEQLQEQVKLFAIPVVVGRSEQLPTDIEIGKMMSDLAKIADDEAEL